MTERSDCIDAPSLARRDALRREMATSEGAE